MDKVMLGQLINKAKKQYLEKKGEYNNVIKSKEEKQKDIEKLKKKHDNLDKERIFLMKSCDYQRNKIKSEFETTVSQALQYIMEEDIHFMIDIDEVRKRAEAEFSIKSIRDGIETTTGIEECRGDGIADIVSLALDISKIECAKPKNEGPLIMDEPTKQVSEVYIPNTGKFMKDISSTFNRQMIIITHNKKLADYADAKFEVSLNGTISEVNAVYKNEETSDSEIIKSA